MEFRWIAEELMISKEFNYKKREESVRRNLLETNGLDDHNLREDNKYNISNSSYHHQS